MVSGPVVVADNMYGAAMYELVRVGGDALAGEMGWSSTDNGENVIAFFRAFPRVSASGVRANRRARANETSSIDVTRARERGVVE